MTDSNKPIVFFLGATGGCTLSTLVHALQDGYHCTALARTPSKLIDLLKEAGVAEPALTSLLTVDIGNATDVSSVRAALLRHSDNHHRLPDFIISGIGGSPRMQFALPPFTIDQPTVCEDSANALVTALSEIHTAGTSSQSSKPLLCYVSTGGMYPGHDDIPWLLRMMYNFLLSVPWRDKQAMERVYGSERSRKVFSRSIAVKVSLLTDGPEIGNDAVRTGTKERAVSGCSISRKDVGGWIYRNIIVGAAEGWEGEMVSITY